MVAGKQSNLVCPACGIGHTLTSRAWADVSALECQRCAGLWLGNEAFKHLTDQAAAEGLNVENRQRPQTARPPQVDTPPPDGGVRYRACAVCNQLMVKRNFGRHSGVVIDVCGRHGVWLDADELPRIIDWIHAGGLAQANEEEVSQRQADDFRKNAKLDAILMQRDDQLSRTSTAPISPFLNALRELTRRLFQVH
jgi:Zn-finger nucleic acid-binding protein